MDSSELLAKVQLGYLSLDELREWLNQNLLWEKNFDRFKEKWKENLSPFLVDSELLLIEKEIVLLQIPDSNVREYLAKTYQIKEQVVCQKVFGESKNLVLLTKEQWQKLRANKHSEDFNSEYSLVLWQDENSIQNSLTKWLKS